MPRAPMRLPLEDVTRRPNASCASWPARWRGAARRGTPAAVLVRLGRLLSERGRALAAVRAFEAASALADDANDEAQAAEARVWLATSKTDMRQLAEAEALCRAASRAFAAGDARAHWAAAVLARVSLWQGRTDEARALVDAVPTRQVIDERSAYIEATAVRVLLAAADVFAAGQRLREGPTDASMMVSPLTQAITAGARLRFHCAVGDLSGAEREYGVVRGLAKVARAPLREVRAGLLWADGLRRAGLLARADRELARMRRLGRAAPPLLRHQLDEGPRPPAIASAVLEPARVLRLAALIDTCRNAAGDDALTAAVGQALGALAARRIDVLAADRPRHWRPRVRATRLRHRRWPSKLAPPSVHWTSRAGRKWRCRSGGTTA